MKRSIVPLTAALVVAASTLGCEARREPPMHEHPREQASAAAGSSSAKGLTPGAPLPVEAPSESTIPDSPLGKSIRRGKELLTNTKELLPENVGASLTCSSCHRNAGTTANAGHFVGIVDRYPVYRARTGSVITLNERIDECFERSMNGKALPSVSPERAAIVAYMTWLSKDVPRGAEVEGRGFGAHAAAITANPDHGKELFATKCASCHGADGAGLPGAAPPASPPPLAGPSSFNIGAGMARLDTAAAFIKSNMPLARVEPLSEQDAYDLAAHVVYLPRPTFAGLAKDWPLGNRPRDARSLDESKPTRSKP